MFYRLAFLSTALCLATAAAAADTSTQIQTVELSFNDAAKDAASADLQTLIADDFVYQHGSGETYDKATYISLLVTGAITVETRGPLAIKLHDFGAVAVAYGESPMSGKLDGAAYNGRLRFLNIWRKQDGRWRLTHRNSELLPL